MSEEQIYQMLNNFPQIEIVKYILNLQDENETLKKILDSLKNQPTVYLTKYMDNLGFVETKTLNQLIKELEEKYKL